jgi:hypothetical protein
MRTVNVKLQDQLGEDAGHLLVILGSSDTHVRREIERRLDGEKIISVKKEFETGKPAQWVARIEI